MLLIPHESSDENAYFKVDYINCSAHGRSSVLKIPMLGLLVINYATESMKKDLDLSINIYSSFKC